MFTPKFELAKKSFIDIKKLEDAADKGVMRTMVDFGGYTRKIAQNSIKTMDANQHSLAGNPPYGHNGPLRYKDFIFFWYDQATRAVYIGPIKLNGTGMKPKTLELGGTAETKVLVNGKQVKVMANYKPRPHMKPAFDKARKAKLKQLLKNSIVKG